MSLAMVVALALAVVAALAPAASAKSLGGFIGGPFGVNTGGLFTQPRDVAVSETGAGAADPGDIYVVEGMPVNHRVSVLDADGNFKFAFGRDVIAPGGAGDLGDVFEKCAVATDCKAGSFGSAADGPGGELATPQGIAINQATGEVYVREVGGSTTNTNRRVSVFDAAGNFVRAFGWDVVQTGGVGDDTVAPVNELEVCTVASECKPGSSGAGAGQFLSASNDGAGLAVSPVNGDVFAADSANRRINQYEADGDFIRAWGWEVDNAGSAAFEVCTTASGCGIAGSAGTNNGRFSNNSPLALAVDSQNVVYAADSSSGTSANRIVRFDADSAPVAGNATANLLSPINPTGSGGPLLATTTAANGLEIDPDTDGGGPDEETLLASRDPNTPSSASTVVQELDIPTDTTAGELPADPVTVIDTHTYAASTVNGLGVSPLTENIYLPIGLANPPSGPGQGLMVLASGVGALGAPTTAPASEVGSTTANLAGAFDPGSGAVSYRFEVSADGAEPYTQLDKRYLTAPAGTRQVTFQATGLDPNTVYRARLTVSKQTGLNTSTTLTSSEVIFVTDAAAPEAVTSPVGPRTDTAAELRGTVDPNGTATGYWFQYGPDANYGTNVPVLPASAGSGNQPVAVAEQITGLQPNTTYHYRIVADGFAAPVFGGDQTFTTQPTPPGHSAAGARGYELVTPADKVSGPGIGQHGNHSELDGENGLNVGLPSINGERLISSTVTGPVLARGGAVYVNDHVLSERVSDQVGWTSASAYNLRNYTASTQPPFLELVSASNDLSLMAWDNIGGFAELFSDMPALSLPKYARDWEGRWQLLSPTDAPSSFGRAVPAFAADGSALAIRLASDGLLGSTDPSLDFTSLTTTYLYDASAGFSNSFAGSGPTELIGTCSAGTQVPEVLTSGKLDAQDCAPVAAGRSAAVIDKRGASIYPGDDGGTVKNLVSGDGSRTFFMSPDPQAGDPDGGGPLTAGGAGCGTGTGAGTSCPAQLYVRQRNADGSVSVRWLSQSTIADQDTSLMGVGSGDPVNGAFFEGASADGDKVFFRTNAPLTADDPNGLPAATPGGVKTGSASNESWDLYMFDLAPGDDPAGPGSSLTRISAGPTGASDCNSPLDGGKDGALRFVSDDGSRAYFTCAAPLAGVADPGNGTITMPGGSTSSATTTNLYLYDANRPPSQRWTFVARLPRGDRGNGESFTIADCATTASNAAQSRRSSSVSSGEFQLNVEGGNTCARGSADGRLVTFWTNGRLTADDPDEVSADIYAYDAVADSLIRITASQGGAGGSYECVSDDPRTPAADESIACYGDMGFRALTDGRAYESQLNVATRPGGSGDQAAYFESRSRLVAEDSDDEMDVYEWRNGNLSLISVGVTEHGAYYSGNSADGEDVFFRTDAALTWQDIDGVADVYDARVGGGVAEPTVAPVCAVLAGGCHGPGIGVPTATQIASDKTGGGGNASPGVRKKLRVGNISRKARRRAARRGVLPVRVRTNRAGLVRVLARAKIGKRTRRVAGGKVRVRKAGAVTVKLRLNRAAKRRLRSGRALRVTLRVASPGARARTATVRLKRGRRS